MRITYVAWHGSVHTRRWVSFFAERGHEVDVVTCGDGDAFDLDEHGEKVARAYRIHDLGAPRFGKLGYLFKLRRARRVIRSLEPEVVHAHFATSYGLLALASGVRPLVVTAHGDDVLIAPRSRLLRSIVKRVLRAARIVTLPSEHMRAAVTNLLGSRADDVEVAVFQYGVEVDRLRRVADSVWAERVAQFDGAPGAHQPVRLVSARAMLRLYRIDALLDAVALLRERGTAVTLDLLGDGPERAALAAQARELGIDADVRFRGHCSSYEVERSIAAADIYVSVAESDGVSLALLESMVLGAVPVLSDIPANRGWVHHGATGALVAIDPEAIADGIELAAALDRGCVAADNRAVVAERADRATNLGACELLIDSLVGVEFDPTPVTRSDAA